MQFIYDISGRHEMRLLALLIMLFSGNSLGNKTLNPEN